MHPVVGVTTWMAFGAMQTAVPGVKVKVPAGEFVCTMYFLDLLEPYGGGIGWFAPGVGLVKYQWVDEEGVSTFELTAYTLKQ